MPTLLVTESTHRQINCNKDQVFHPESLEMKEKKKSCRALFCLINVLYALKAASIDAVIYIMKESFLKRYF